jgi:protein involved in ribonucleotide reduction
MNLDVGKNKHLKEIKMNSFFCKYILSAICIILFALQTPCQCSKDTDCKGNRVCVDGKCVDPKIKNVQPDTIHSSYQPNVQSQESSLPLQNALQTTPSPAQIARFKLKDPFAAVTLSFLFPGGGHYYNGDIGNGVIYTLSTAASIVGIIICGGNENWNGMYVFFAAAGAVHAADFIHAGVAAANYNNKMLSLLNSKDSRVFLASGYDPKQNKIKLVLNCRF